MKFVIPQLFLPIWLTDDFTGRVTGPDFVANFKKEHPLDTGYQYQC